MWPGHRVLSDFLASLSLVLILVTGLFVVSTGDIALAWITSVMSGNALVALLLTASAAFAAVGGFLLRRRIVAPLRKLAVAAREIGNGTRGTRVRVEGDGEVAEVALAINEMTDALEQRSVELEKVVFELRDTNRSLRRARDGLDRAERLASVGSLAAGVAHEVGNPMGALLAFLDLAKRDSELSVKTREHLNRASEQGSRVREILRQLLDFSRPPRSVPMPVDLAAVARQTLGLVRAQSRYEEVEIEMDDGDCFVKAVGDESVVAQILLNLMLNACDAALDSAPPARVVVTLRLAPFVVRLGDVGDQGAARKSMDGIECEVADSGPGVLEEDRERVFDPFFTTKDPGEGTGLGLANAQKLAEELGGVVELKRTGPLAGAAFALKLPIEFALDTGVRGVD